MGLGALALLSVTVSAIKINARFYRQYQKHEVVTLDVAPGNNDDFVESVKKAVNNAGTSTSSLMMISLDSIPEQNVNDMEMWMRWVELTPNAREEWDRTHGGKKTLPNHHA